MGRRYGQHFLTDQNVVDSIMEAAGLRPGDAVLEVGPGEGVLTGRLIQAGARLSVVEVDGALAEALEARWGGQPGFRVIHGDILKQPLDPQFLFGEPVKYSVVANLPYYLTTPLLFRIVRVREHLERLILMVQKEVGVRMAAGPSRGKEYGALSIAAGHAFELEVVRRVPPSAFRPPPRVDSVVVGLTPRAPSLKPEQEAAFMEHVKMLFTRRRKRMASGLNEHRERMGEAAWASLQERLGNSRAEEFTPAEHLEIFRMIHCLDA